METTDKSNDPLTLIELTIPFVKYLTSENLKFLYKVVKPLAKVRGLSGVYQNWKNFF